MLLLRDCVWGWKDLPHDVLRHLKIVPMVLWFKITPRKTNIKSTFDQENKQTYNTNHHSLGFYPGFPEVYKQK